MSVMEAFGEALVVEPYLPTLMGGLAVARSPLARSILPAVVEGKMKLAFAHAEKGARYDLGFVKTQARKAGEGWTLEGEKAGVVGAPMADRLVVSAAAPDGVALFLAENPAGKPYRTVDEMRAADPVFRGAKAERLDGGIALVEELTDFAAALVCAEAVGAMKFACDTTLEYLKTRKQFGVPIGTFQALQHRMVDMFIALEEAVSFTQYLNLSLAAKEPHGSKLASGAKSKVGNAARFIAEQAVQLHGGMGMSDELNVGHYFKRIASINTQYGDPTYHLMRYAQQA